MGVIESTHGAKAGHPGGSLSAADLFAYLYNRELRIDPKNPKDPKRDRFVLSKGHTAPGLYAALAYRGFFPVEDLPTLRHIDSYLQGHPNMNTVPGVDMSTGSLGQGISAAAGMAKGAKYLHQDVNVYTLLTCDVMNTAPVDEKAKAFGFQTISIDGHDFDQIEKAFEAFHACTGKPTCILMHTTKGKGVSFMENQVGWHGKAPNDEEYKQAMEELHAAMAELEAAK